MPKLVEQNITENLLRSIQPRNERFDLYDGKLRGLGIRVSPSGTKSWFVMTRVNGRMTRKTIGRYPHQGLQEARILGAEALVQMARGEVENPYQSKLFRDVFEEWLERDQSENRTVDRVRKAMMLHALPPLGACKLDAIQKRDIIRIIDNITDRGSLVQANRVLSYLRRFFNWCVERDYTDGNPTHGIAKPTREQGRDRVLSPEEIKRVMIAAETLGAPFGPFILLLLLTGQRREEVAGMRWSEINLAEAKWVLPSDRSKNGKAHTVHLSSQALAILTGIPQVDGVDLVFPATHARRGKLKGPKGSDTRPISGFSKAKKRVDEASGVTGWNFHDLRRSFATHTTESLNLNPVVIDKILNHQSGIVRGVAAVYQQGKYLAERRAALQAWGTWLENL